MALFDTNMDVLQSRFCLWSPTNVSQLYSISIIFFPNLIRNNLQVTYNFITIHKSLPSPYKIYN
jgi:hypothetical protein